MRGGDKSWGSGFVSANLGALTYRDDPREVGCRIQLTNDSPRTQTWAPISIPFSLFKL